MASNRAKLDSVLHRLRATGTMTARAMFGEYGIYCDGKIVALFCDDRLFVRPTEPGRALLRRPVEAPPYPGAKLHFLIEERIRDVDKIARLIRITADALPAPKPKAPKPKPPKPVGRTIRAASGRRSPGDPTADLRAAAAAFAGVDLGRACNQTSFKAGKGTFLFLGPGAKGVGFKAMFKLKTSAPEARKLAAQHPERFEVGTTGWVTARFSAETPLPKRLWSKWLAESHALTCGTAPTASGPK